MWNPFNQTVRWDPKHRISALLTLHGHQCCLSGGQSWPKKAIISNFVAKIGSTLEKPILAKNDNEYRLAIVSCTDAVHSIMYIVVAIQLLNSLLILSNKN